MGLSGQWADKWGYCTEILKTAGINLSNEKDTLVWSENKKNGVFIAKLAYDFMIKKFSHMEVSWWSKGLWKWNIPAKLRFFWWLSLKDKILTWKN